MAVSKIQQVTNNSGSNYCKMPDGTLMCWGRIVFPDAAVGRQDVSQDYPVTFVVLPMVIASWHDNAGTIKDYFNTLTTKIGIDTVSQVHVSANRIRTGYTWYADWIAIGRWK